MYTRKKISDGGILIMILNGRFLLDTNTVSMHKTNDNYYY